MRSIFSAAAHISVALGLISCGPGQQTNHYRLPDFAAATVRPVTIIAHRGHSRGHPENTMRAFVAALDNGADVVEFDYHHARDGAAIVIHDQALNRTTNVAEYLGEELALVKDQESDFMRELDAGSWFSQDAQGERLPLVPEALAAITPRRVALMERKAGDAPTCAAMVAANGIREHVLVQSFDWEFLQELHGLDPEIGLVALAGLEITAAKLERAASFGSKVINWSHRYIDKAAIDLVHARGLKIWAYTVNSPARATQLIEMGIDGLVTDRPQAMRKLLR